ncbi:hypothetical protein DL98DRAFT_427501, partial [Cadophora sp. DSE1049]
VPVTYDHRLRNLGHPVRSAVLKPQIGGLVVGWVTTSEYPLLYVFAVFFAGQTQKKGRGRKKGIVALFFVSIRHHQKHRKEYSSIEDFRR